MFSRIGRYTGFSSASLGLAAWLLGLAAPAAAQSWTAAVTLGHATSTGASLSMNNAGQADLVFDNTVSTVGELGIAQIGPGQPWQPVTYSFSSSDAFDGGIGLDGNGATTLLFNGGQIDNYNSVVDQCSQSSFAGPWTGCGFLAVNRVMSTRPQILNALVGGAYHPIYLVRYGCDLESGDTVTGFAAQLDDATDCPTAATFALSPAGTGVAIFATKAGLVRAATRDATGTWSTPATLATAAKLPIGGLTATAGSDGSSVVAYEIGRVGRPGAQIWAAPISATGSVSTPVQLATKSCGTSVAAATMADGTELVAFGVAGVHGGCEAGLSARSSLGSFAAPVVVTSGAHAGSLALVATAAGNLALAWKNGASGGVFAASGTLAGFGAAVKLGAGVAAPLLAAGGGYVNAAWCITSCYAATLMLP